MWKEERTAKHKYGDTLLKQAQLEATSLERAMLATTTSVFSPHNNSNQKSHIKISKATKLAETTEAPRCNAGLLWLPQQID
jgi:hypothetical protein